MSKHRCCQPCNRLPVTTPSHFRDKQSRQPTAQSPQKGNIFWPQFASCCLLALTILWPALPLHGQRASRAHPLPAQALAREHFGNDAPWYLANIPFFEVDDADIQRTYYYRWQLYRSHLREIGTQGTDITEFLPGVPWARHPYEDLNDSSAFHIMEGRWLRQAAYVRSLIDHLYAGAGNDRHFSEWIAAATLGWTEVTGDTAPALRNLRAMQYVYNAWDDHFDATRGLYWIEPLLDATEYTISSIDASGAGFNETRSGEQSGFFGGYSFRPSINAYQFGNAKAIARFAGIAGNPELSSDYNRRAEVLRDATERQLWNPALQHFTDIYQRSTPTVKAGDFIRGRELVGLVPWLFEMPDQTSATNYTAAWQHALSATELAGPYGLRTVEPSYPRYMVQYRYDKPTGQRECQWNGPSWPFQTSQALTAMSNLLHDYPQTAVTRDDFVRLLRQYTAQHRRADGVLDLQEDYDPDTGRAIVGLPRSHHYNHSTYIDVLLTGLLGIRPSLDASLVIDPLLPAGGEKPIRYFALQDLQFHGHLLTILYDSDGSRYHQGAGLTVYADGRQMLRNQSLGRVSLPLPAARHAPGATLGAELPQDLAVNVWGRAPGQSEPSLPIATASSSASDQGLYEAIDGRMWFTHEVPHGWSPAPVSGGGDDWLSVDWRDQKVVDSVDVAFLADGARYAAPAAVRLEVRTDGRWRRLTTQGTPAIVANGVTTLRFAHVTADALRIVMARGAGQPERVMALRVFGPPPESSRSRNTR